MPPDSVHASKPQSLVASHTRVNANRHLETGEAGTYMDFEDYQHTSSGAEH